MSIQHAANHVPATPVGQHHVPRQTPVLPPRVLQSARAPAQLSFAFKRG